MDRVLWSDVVQSWIISVIHSVLLANKVYVIMAYGKIDYQRVTKTATKAEKKAGRKPSPSASSSSWISLHKNSNSLQPRGNPCCSASPIRASRLPTFRRLRWSPGRFPYSSCAWSPIHAKRRPIFCDKDLSRSSSMIRASGITTNVAPPWFQLVILRIRSSWCETRPPTKLWTLTRVYLGEKPNLINYRIKHKY